MSEEKTRVWAAAAVASVALIAMTILLALHVDVTQIGTTLAMLSGLVNLFLYNELRQVKQNTNGTLEKLQQRVDDLTQHVARSIPVDAIEELRK